MTGRAYRDAGDGRRGGGSPGSVRWVAGWAALLLALSLAGCGSTGPAPVDSWNWKGPVPKGYYLVRRGDTLSEIAQRKRISMGKLARWNRLKAPYTVYAGRLIRIKPPDGRAVVSSKPSGKRRASKVAASPGRSRGSARQAKVLTRDTATGLPGSRRAASGLPWAWPIDGPIKQRFNGADRTRQGLRIGCRAGEPVRASASGRVVYSGSGLKGYGNLIIVKHNDKYLSAYGFNQRLFAKEGGRVERGQTVAECGQGPEGAHLLHFEVRRNGTAVDPILYLPPRG